MKKVLITAPYAIRERAKVQGLLNGHPLEVTWADVRERLEEDDLMRIIHEYHGILCGDDRITNRVIERAINLEVIVKWGTGIDSIDKDYALSKGIPVRNTLGAFNNPVADTTVGMILYFSRRLKDNDRLMKSGSWDKPVSYCLSEMTIGIIGLGNTGKAVAKRLSSFETRLLANDILEIDPSFLEAHNVTMVTKDEIYKECDFITLHCDLNETSRHLLSLEAFKKMQKKPYVINNARGPLIDEQALIDALGKGVIAGAGLDVFEHEPLPKESILRKLDNTLLSSHNSNSSPQHWDRIHLNSVKMLLEGLNVV